MTLKLSKLLLLMAVVTIAGARLLCADNSVNNAVYGLYSETYAGVHFDAAKSTPPVINDPDGAAIYTWGDQPFTDTLHHTEGNVSLGFLTVGIGGWGGFMIGFDKGSGGGNIDRNFSAYTGGSIDFDIMLNNTSPYYTPPSAVQVQLKWANSSPVPAQSDVITLDQYNVQISTSWQHCSLPLTAFKVGNYNNTGSPWNFVGQPGGDDGIKHFNGMIFNVGISSVQFFVDNLVVKSPSTGSMNVSLTNRYSGVAASSFTWSGVTLGITQWKAADQYIQLNNDYFDTPAGRLWGLRIYTDNTGTGANPQYTGTGNPVGLVCLSSTTQVLPMCWRIVDMSTTTLTIVQGQGTDAKTHLYSGELGGAAGGFSCFLFMADLHTAGFSNTNDTYSTAWDIRGIQYSEDKWGAAMTPNYIYIGACFSNGTTPNTYKTNKLTLELFHD